MKTSSPAIPNLTYYSNIQIVQRFLGWHHQCHSPRDTVQSWIDIASHYVFCTPVLSSGNNTNVLPPITSPCPSNKEFIGLDFWHIAGPCPCTCFKDKRPFMDFYYGTLTAGPPIL